MANTEASMRAERVWPAVGSNSEVGLKLRVPELFCPHGVNLSPRAATLHTEMSSKSSKYEPVYMVINNIIMFLMNIITDANTVEFSFHPWTGFKNHEF